MSKSLLQEIEQQVEEQFNQNNHLREEIYISHKLSSLSPEEEVQIAREYNAAEKPSAKQTQIISQLDVGYSHSRLFNESDAKEVMNAFSKCAANLDAANIDRFGKYEFGRNIKYMVCRHPECSAQAFDALAQHMTDIDVIEPIRSCMSRDNSLIDKGFAAIQKSADAICAAAKSADKTQTRKGELLNPDKAAAQQLNLAFADLYNFSGHLESPEMVDKVTSYFAKFEKQMDPFFCNLDHVCHGASYHSERKVPEVSEKMRVLSTTFEEWKKGKESFTTIYDREKERKQFIDKVSQKVKERNSGKDYLTVKEEGKSGDAGNIARNKILMQAHREVKDAGK